MFRLLKLKEIENGKFDFIELIKISFHFKYYIFCLIIGSVLMSYYYFNNKYPSSLYTQKIVFEEHINSVLHNEILRPLSTRIIELISYKYDELLRVNKKLEMLLEENLLYNEKNNESRKPEIMGGGAFGFELEPFYDFNIFNRYKEIVKNSTQGNLFYFII